MMIVYLIHKMVKERRKKEYGGEPAGVANEL